jgi:hypothetical protein
MFNPKERFKVEIGLTASTKQYNLEPWESIYNSHLNFFTASTNVRELHPITVYRFYWKKSTCKEPMIISIILLLKVSAAALKSLQHFTLLVQCLAKKKDKHKARQSIRYTLKISFKNPCGMRSLKAGNHSV